MDSRLMDPCFSGRTGSSWRSSSRSWCPPSRLESKFACRVLTPNRVPAPSKTVHDVPRRAVEGPQLIPKVVSDPKPAPQVSKTHWRVTDQLLRDVVTMFNSFPLEYDYRVQPAWIEGRIPAELKGTYMRNGPGLQVAGSRYQRHWLDGDGCVLSLAFPGDGAAPRFKNKFVRTKGFVEEQAAGKLLYRNAFTRGAADGSLLFNPLDLNFKNVANTGVLYWGRKLWALWEVGRPYELDPRTLDTVGESDMGGQLGQRLAGHYRMVQEPDGSQRCVLFGTNVTFAGSHLEFYELDEQGGMAAKSKHPLPKADIMFVHDMLVTDHWYVVLMGPMKLDVPRFLTHYTTSRISLGELLVYDKGSDSKILLYPRPGKPTPAGLPPHSHSPQPRVIPAPPAFSFHHVNAYEEDGGRSVVLDTIVWQDMMLHVTQHNVTPDYYDGGCRTQLVRMVADVAAGAVTSCNRVVQRTLEFPTINWDRASGRPYKYAYFAADAVDHPRAWAPAQALLKVTVPRLLGQEPQPGGRIMAVGECSGGDAAGVLTDEWRPGQRCFVQEPMFVPRPGGVAEDDGWVIVGVLNAESQRGEIAILDAARIGAGPLATIKLPHPLPPGLHGCWAPDYLGPDPLDVGVPAWREIQRIKQL